MESNKIFSKQQLTSIITLIIILILINIFLTTMTAANATDLIGQEVEANSYEMKKAILTTLIFTIQIIGFILGILVALIPYKGFAYKQKYLPGSLVSILALHLIIAIICVWKIL